MKTSETYPMVNAGRDNDQNLVLGIVWNYYRTTRELILNEEGAERLRNACQTYLDARRVERRADQEEFYPAPRRPLPQRVSLVTMLDIFESLADSGEPFYCVFTKQDGSERKMWAKMTAPVQYNWSTRKSYANVIDLDLARESDHNCDRKIVIQRVKSLVSNQSEFIANGR